MDAAAAVSFVLHSALIVLAAAAALPFLSYVSSSDTLFLPSSSNATLLASAPNTSFRILLSSDSAFAWQFAPYKSGTRRLLVVRYTLYNSTIVWIANRDHPVSPNATLNVAADSAIALMDGNTSVWSTPSGVSSILMNTTGNLVMMDDRNNTVWQSFDYATDVVVAGQVLRPNQNATASISTDDVSTGHYVLRVEPGGPVLYASFDQQQQNIPYAIMFITYAQGMFGTVQEALNSSCNRTEFIYDADGSGLTLVQVGAISAECEKETNGSTVHNIKISSRLGGDGFRFFRMMPTGDVNSFLDSAADGLKLDNSIFRSFYNTYCKLPAYCSVNSICSSVQTCSCPDYFIAINESDARQGCKLSTPLNCSLASEHQFSPVTGVDYYANSYMSPTANFDSSDECTDLCRGNCSCTAAFYNNQTGDCHLYNQVQTMQSGANPSVTAFLRVAHLNTPTAGGSNVLSKKAIVGLSVGLGLLFIGILIVGVIVGRSLARRSSDDEDSEEEAFLDSLPGLPPRYSFKELEVATKGFSKKLGKGGSSAVFEGEVHSKTAPPLKKSHSGKYSSDTKPLDGVNSGNGGLVKVAVKQLLASGRATIAASGKNQFRQEVAALGSLSHVNLVQLRGFCVEGPHRLLIYEYMENGSLDRWLFQGGGGGGAEEMAEENIGAAGPHVLPWEVRYRIATDTARGLAFLHEGSRAKVVHLDVKPQNILLDANFRAKLADFGLCKLMERTEGGETQTVTAMRGTPGYMAPEWFLNLPITEKSDIFSYGMVLLELVGGRKNVNLAMGSEDGWYFPAWAVRQAERGETMSIIDRHLMEAMEAEDGGNAMESMTRLIKVAFWCIQENASARPAMSTVLLMLESHVEVPEPPLELTYVLRRQPRLRRLSGTTTTTVSSSTSSAATRTRITESMSLLEPR